MTTVTESQRALILLAVETDGRVHNFPEYLKGGVRSAVIRGLLHRELIVADGVGYRLTEAGWMTVGYEWRPTPPPHTSAVVEDDAAVGSEAAKACATPDIPMSAEAEVAPSPNTSNLDWT